MKRTLIIIGSILLVLLIVAGVFGYIVLEKLEEHHLKYQNVVISWMQDESGIQVPVNSSLLEFYTGMEYGKLLKYKLAEETIDSLVTNYGLSKIPPEDAGTLLIIDIEDRWEEEKTRGEKDYYFLEDCKEGLRWILLVERNQGLFWFEVIHADFSGDEPECEKENNDMPTRAH